jgi:tetratricopeptide (TPR) repeat protein
MQLGDEGAARQALTEALALDPHRADALRTAADLDVAAGRLREAAESLIQLARVAKERDVLRACFLELGRIYSQHLPDLRRAEIAYARAVGLAPQDATALEQLMQVLCRKRDHEKALSVCERLIDLARDDAELDRRTVELAAIFEDMGDARRAERALNARRERSPGAPAILAALVDLYARQRDHAALAVHLDRSIHGLRDALLTHPGDAQRWSTLCEVLVRRGRTDEAARAGALACELGAADAQIERLAAPRDGIAAAALAADTVTRIWPDAARDPARPLLRWLEPWVDELLPTPALQRLDAPPPKLQAAARAARAALALPEITLFAMPGSSCVPLRNKPLAIAVGRQLLATCNDEELTFLLVRAAAAARLGLLVAARSDPQELGALLAAARSTTAANDDAAPAPDLLAGLARERLEQQLNPKRRSELHALVAHVTADSLTLHSHALELGARIALAATGALGPALCALAACAAEESGADFEQHDPLLALEDASARALLRFALSEAYMELQSHARSSARPGVAR